MPSCGHGALRWAVPGALVPCREPWGLPPCSLRGGCPVPVLCPPREPPHTQPRPPQVSERFARYLDGKIQELHGAAGSTGLLQQVLEPFVVFSGLEFAHTFEHFYR